ncbi:protein kinase [Candidatus Uabimicrobium sp. HlEnr_7]|uniref:protein kinase domain-containing protein n=1 Tax=Candidatus Uabimicrobium helgolandensis TaxID=3095367 RepID=UPI003558E855
MTNDFEENVDPNIFGKTAIDLNFMGSRFAQYKILGTLGQGGEGKVYKAVDVNLNRSVALKVLLTQDEAKNNKRKYKRFYQEAVSMAKVAHKNIAQIYEANVFEEIPFLAMEVVSGGDLKNYVSNKKLSLSKIALIIAQVAEGMACAHNNKIIHRDLKPSNILMDGDVPKITDFGLAKMNNVPTDVSRSGKVAGTLQYMPPEQAHGSKVDKRADIYAIGCILYELLTGRLPFTASTAISLMFQITHEEVVPPSRIKRKIPKELEYICLKALEKKPKDRYKNASDFAIDLRNFANKETPPSIIGYSPKWMRIKRKIKSYKHFIFITILLGVLVIFWSGSTSSHSVDKNQILLNWKNDILQKLKKQKLEHSDFYTYQKHHYMIIKTPTSWEKADIICRSLGGYLTTITDLEESNFVMSIVNRGKEYWIGLKREINESTFKWVTKEELLFKNWSIIHRKPKETRSKKVNFVKMTIELDNSCSWLYQKTTNTQPFFICEWGKNRKAVTGHGRNVIARFSASSNKIKAINMEYPRNLEFWNKHFIRIRSIGKQHHFVFEANSDINDNVIFMLRNFSGMSNGKSKTYIDINLNGRVLRKKYAVIYQNAHAEYLNVSDYIKKGKNKLSISMHRDSRTIYFIKEIVIYTTSLRKKHESK